MPLINQTGPHLSAQETTRTVLGDMLIALAPLVGMAYYYYGGRALIHVVVSVVVCWLADFVCTLLMRRKPNLLDFSPIVTGTLLALLLPAAAPYWLTALGALFASVVMKQAFGGLGNNLFNPAAGALAFLTICWPSRVVAYTMPFVKLELWGNVTAAIVESPAATLSFGGTPALSMTDLLLGNFAGPLGANNLMLAFACLLFLTARKTLNVRIPAAFTIVVVLFAWMFPRVAGMTRIDSVLYEILAGTVPFFGFFVATDPVTAPRTNAAKWIYGAVCGLLVMVFRYYGAYLTGAPFAILLMNSTSNALDRLLLSVRYGFMKPRIPKRARLKGYRKPPKVV